MKVAVPRALLHLDPCVVMRSAATVDAEGLPNAERVRLAGVNSGTWRELTAREQIFAAQRGTIFDAEMAFELSYDIQAGDWITVVGNTYEVIDTDAVRTYRRARLRGVKE